MLDVFNIASPQNGNVQYFYKNSTWVKPRGVSHVYMMLIGCGAQNSFGSGASGAVTTWYGAAQHVPDNLVMLIGSTGVNDPTTANYRGTNGLNVLLTANGGYQTTPGAAMTPNQFTATGFFQSVDGVAGASAPATTFLTSGTSGTTLSNYGYSTTRNGFFMTQPIIVSCGGGYDSLASPGNSGIGCGNAFDGSVSAGKFGPGLAVIAAW